MGPPAITFYLFKLELSVAKCRKDNAHVGVELLVVEHLSHLLGILPDGLVDSEPLLRTLQLCQCLHLSAEIVLNHFNGIHLTLVQIEHG